VIDFSQFQNLGFEDYRKRALDPNLSGYEKVGYRNSYCDGYGDARGRHPALQAVTLR
jgi:hypothetical protein